MGYNGTPIKLRPRLDDARGISFGKAFLLELYSILSVAPVVIPKELRKSKRSKHLPVNQEKFFIDPHRENLQLSSSKSHSEFYCLYPRSFSPPANSR